MLSLFFPEKKFQIFIWVNNTLKIFTLSSHACKINLVEATAETIAEIIIKIAKKCYLMDFYKHLKLFPNFCPLDMPA